MSFTNTVPSDRLSLRVHSEIPLLTHLSPLRLNPRQHPPLHSGPRWHQPLLLHPLQLCRLVQRNRLLPTLPLTPTKQLPRLRLHHPPCLLLPVLTTLRLAT